MFFLYYITFRNTNQKGYTMEQNLNQKLEKAFLALDGKRVKSLLEMGADKNHSVRSRLLFSCMGSKPDPHHGRASYPKRLEEYENKLKLAELLLQNGANPNICDAKYTYDSPLTDSLYNSNYKLATLLKKYGANIDIRDHAGDTPLLTFSENIDCARLPEMKFLCKNGANINAKNSFNGKNALMNITGWDVVCASDLFMETQWVLKPVKYLVDNGINVNAVDKDGKTALIHSLSQNWDDYYNEFDEVALEYKDNFHKLFYYDIPKILYANGARIDIVDNSGHSAMDYANRNNIELRLFTRAIDNANRILRNQIIKSKTMTK